MTRFRRIRLRTAGILARKNFKSWPPTAPAPKRKLSRLIPRSDSLSEWMRPKDRILPQGFRRIPKSWLEEEAIHAVSRISTNMKKEAVLEIASPVAYWGALLSGMGAGFFVGGGSGKKLGGLMGMLVFGGLVASRWSKKVPPEIRKDIEFLQQYFRKQTNPKMSELIRKRKLGFL